MKDEKNYNYYDKIYSNSLEYNKNYKQSIYYQIWVSVVSFIDKEDNILEIGCGSGQFASMLFDLGYNNYFGFDFSDEAIKLAKKKGLNVKRSDAYKSLSYPDKYDKVICLETLEHVDDYKVLSMINKGSEIVLTVPDFDDISHLRFFKNENQVIDRYKDLIDIQHIEKIKRWFLIKGVVL